jgi:hypothetical protein
MAVRFAIVMLLEAVQCYGFKEIDSSTANSKTDSLLLVTSKTVARVSTSSIAMYSY